MKTCEVPSFEDMLRDYANKHYPEQPVCYLTCMMPGDTRRAMWKLLNAEGYEEPIGVDLVYAVLNPSTTLIEKLEKLWPCPVVLKHNI